MGWNLDYIKNHVDDCKGLYAIESSLYCSKHIIDKVGADLITNDVETDWQKGHPSRFDLVIMRHSLEHFLNPMEVLRKVNFVLSDKGFIYIAVPDMMSPQGSLYNSYFRAVHTYYFSINTLLRVAALAQLKSVVIKSENGEIWCVLKKATDNYTVNSNSVFIKQLNVINTYGRKRFFKDKIIFLPKMLMKNSPKFLKALFPKPLKEFIRRYLRS